MLWTLAPAGVLGWTENAMVSKPNMRTHELSYMHARRPTVLTPPSQVDYFVLPLKNTMTNKVLSAKLTSCPDLNILPNNPVYSIVL